MSGNRSGRFIRISMAFLAAALIMPGCRGQEKQKEGPRKVEAGPATPPGILLYVSQGKVWKVRKGEQAEILPTRAAWFPAVNPDGTMMAYWEDEGDAMSLHVMNLISRADIKIGQWNTLGSLGRNFNLRNAPCWHLKKEIIYFADGAQIWQVNGDGTDLMTLYEHRPENKPEGCYSVTVSPDATRLAFVGVTEKEQNLWLYSTLTKQAQPLAEYTAHDGMAGAPAWSPAAGSDRIMFVRYKAEESNLWAISTDGGSAQQLTFEGRTNSPKWDPAGGRLVVSSGTQNPSSWQIALLKGEDGRFLSQLTSMPAGAFTPSIAGEW